MLLAQTYKIKKGDTLSKIAKQFGTDVNTLAKLNNISNPNLIIAGTTLKLPGGGSSSPAPSSSSGSSSKIQAPKLPKIPKAPNLGPAPNAPTIDPFSPNINMDDLIKQAAELLAPGFDKLRRQAADTHTETVNALDNDSLRRGIARSSYAGNRIDKAIQEYNELLKDIGVEEQTQTNLLASQNYDKEYERQYRAYQDDVANKWRGYEAEYGKYRDSVADAWREYTTNLENIWRDYEAKYKQYRDAMEDEYRRWEQEFQQAQFDFAKESELWNRKFQERQLSLQAKLGAARSVSGSSSRSSSSSSSSRSSSSRSSSSSKGLTSSQNKEMREYVGLIQNIVNDKSVSLTQRINMLSVIMNRWQSEAKYVDPKLQSERMKLVGNARADLLAERAKEMTQQKIATGRISSSSKSSSSSTSYTIKRGPNYGWGATV